MQPCPSCGGMGIDANGYCTQCRTYRGIPQMPPPPPSSGAPYSGAPYSGAPYSGGAPPRVGYPASGPSFPDQVSSPPFPPATYGGAYGAPTNPPSKRSSLMVPLLALSGVLALLVVAIVVVAVVKNSGDDPGTDPAPGAQASQPAKSLVDECVVGTWETVTYTEQVAIDGVGDVPFKLEKNPPTLKFSKDGKLTQTYRGSVFGATMPVEGQSVKVLYTIDATASSDFRTNDGGMTYSNVNASGKGVVTASGTPFREEVPFDPGDDPSKYTCSNDTLSLTTSRINTELKRVS